MGSEAKNLEQIHVHYKSLVTPKYLIILIFLPTFKKNKIMTFEEFNNIEYETIN